MALKWAWGWEIDTDDSDYDNWTVTPGFFGLVTNYGASAQPGGGVGGGAFCMLMGRGGDILTPTVVDSATFWVGCWVRLVAGDEWRDSAGNLLEVQRSGPQTMVSIIPSAFGASASLELYVNTTGTTMELVGSTSTALAAGTWYWIALKVDATGAVDATLYIDGVEELQGTATSGGGYTGETLWFNGACDAGHYILVDSVIVYDSLTDPGEVDHFIQGLRPNADNTDGSFSPSSGSDIYAVIDDGSSTDYAESTTDPDTVLVDVESRADIDAGWDPPTVVGVGTVGMCRGDAGNGNAIVRHGSTSDTGANFALSVNPSMSHVIAAVNPDTSSAWTSAELDAVIGGYTASGMTDTQLDGLVVEVVWNEEIPPVTGNTVDFLTRRASF